MSRGIHGLRRMLLQILTTLADKFADRPFSYLWAEGGAQPKLETSLGVGGSVFRPSFTPFPIHMDFEQRHHEVTP